MTKAKLVIMRHGQTPYNVLGLMPGQEDVPLNEMGEEQAVGAGPLIAHIRFDQVITSDLRRAFNTAALALEASNTQHHLYDEESGWKIRKSHKLAEIDTGDFTGRPDEGDPEVKQLKQRQHHEPWPGGESEAEVVARLRDIHEKEIRPLLERGENVLVVAHAGIVRLFDIVLGLAEEPGSGAPTAEFYNIPNASPFIHTCVDGVVKHTKLIENPKAEAGLHAPPPPPKARNRRGMRP
jgi:broad specificity phosphatase PhoE